MMKLTDLDLINSELTSIKKLKVMAKLFKDNGNEFKGELELPNNNIITYEFYQDHRRKTIVNISKNIEKQMSLEDRTANYNKIIETLINLNLFDLNNKNIVELKKKALQYKTNGGDLIGNLTLHDGKKIVYELYGNYKHESIVKFLGENDILTKSERNKIYNEIVSGLKKIGIWDHTDENITKLKEFIIDYRDNATERIGELPLSINKKFVYEFYKDKRKTTFVRISNEKSNNKSDSDSDNDVPDLIRSKTN
jgi:hypothetical protein